MNVQQMISIIDGEGLPREIILRELLMMRGSDLVQFMREMKFETVFQDPDFETVLQRMLSRIPDTIDKRQGSIIYDALAPAAVELTEAMLEREANRALSYASMSNGEWLDLRVAEHGISRMPATQALRKAMFFCDEEMTRPYTNAPLGGRYSVPNEFINYRLTREMGNGEYELTCEEVGQIGNQTEEGTLLLPVDYLSGLAVVILDEVLKPGEEQENDEALYDRFIESITRPPFGGNRADYEEYFRKIDGMGDVKLYRASPMQGHVTAIALGADWRAPSAQMIERAQTILDPTVNAGEGIGQAPIAHQVHVLAATECPLDIEAKLVMVRGWDVGQIQEGATEAIEEYFLELRKHWADYAAIGSAEYVDTIVRIAQIEAAILQTEGVADITYTKIMGLDQNRTMSYNQIPILGNVTFTI